MQLFELAAHYGSGMIFQRGRPILIEGEASAACEITATLGGDSVRVAIEKGPFSINLPARGADRGLNLTLKAKHGDGTTCQTTQLSDIYIGEVWFANGQSNMQWHVRDSDEFRQNPVVKVNEDLRFYSVGRNIVSSPRELDEGYDWAFSTDYSWRGCDEESAPRFSAVAYYFAHTLYDVIKVPIGIVNCNVGGSSIYSWIPEEDMKANPEIAFLWDVHTQDSESVDPAEARAKYHQHLDGMKADDIGNNVASQEGELGAVFYGEPGPFNYQRLGILYKSMLKRVSAFPARGMLWYQGESEAWHEGGKHYAAALESLVGLMKRRQNYPDFAFNYIQLAPFEDNTPYWATVCDQMRKFMLSHPDYAMITIGDVGCPKDIHPPIKRPLGERLAFAAMHRTYDINREFTGPIAEKATRIGDEIRISFIHAKGLHQRPVSPGRFELVYEDGTVTASLPEIRDDAVFLPLPEGLTPQYVRYEFVASPHIGLFNFVGLPASLFELPVE